MGCEWPIARRILALIEGDKRIWVLGDKVSRYGVAYTEEVTYGSYGLTDVSLLMERITAMLQHRSAGKAWQFKLRVLALDATNSKIRVKVTCTPT